MPEVKTVAQEIPQEGSAEYKALCESLPLRAEFCTPVMFVGWAAGVALTRCPPGYIPRRVIVVCEKAK
jgi:hypothetical protein